MATWYLGPSGDMRALESPEPDIRMTTVRYGGVHRGLSGAATVDVTGFRDEYEFRWDYMEDAEWSWLRALHTRHVRGPFRLLNPMRKNRLSIRATTLDTTFRTRGGVRITAGSEQRYDSWPAEAGPGNQCLRWYGLDSTGFLTFDLGTNVPVFPLEQVTASVYLRAGGAMEQSIALVWADKAGNQIGATQTTPVSLTTSWQRFPVTASAPSGAVSAVLGIIAQPTANSIFIAAPQFEAGDAATAWEQGGGAPLVHVDQLETTSPRFPLTNVQMTLLEA